MNSRTAILGGCLALVVASVLLHWPTWRRELWNLDEASTCVFAEHVLHGDVLYRDVVDTRSPLMVYLIAGLLAVGGHWNMTAQHAAMAIALGLTAALLWRLASRLGAGGAGAWTALVFTLASLVMLDPADAFQINTEWFVAFFSATGFWLLAVAWRGARAGPAWLAGVAFAFSYLSKQPGLLDFGTAVCWLLILAGADPAGRPARLRQLAALLAGFGLTFGAVLLYFAAVGAIRDYQFYVWTYSTRYYLPEVAPLDRLIRLRMPFVLAWRHGPLLLATAAAGGALLAGGLVRSWRRRLAGQELPLLALGWFASGFLGSGLSGREYGHYAIQVLPGFSLLCGWALDAGWRRARTWRGWRAALAHVVVLAPLAAAAVTTERRLTSLDLSDDLARMVSRVVRANTTPDERIFTWGYCPEISYYSQRLSASRFVWSIFLTGMIPWTNVAFEQDTAYAIIPGAWDQLWQDFERHPPAVIIDTGGIRAFFKYPLSRQARLWEYVQSHYVEIEADAIRPLGLRVYRRTGATLSGPVDPVVDPALELDEELRNQSPTGVFHARLPNDLRAAELVINGRGTGAVRFLSGEPHQLTFTSRPGRHDPGATVRVRAQYPDGSISAGPEVRLDERPPPLVPVLTFGGAAYPALVAESPPGVNWVPVEQYFVANAPARLVFERPLAVNSVAFTFGIQDGAIAAGHEAPTDGVDLLVNFLPAAGPARRLLTRPLRPLTEPADRGRQPVTVALPPDEPGRLEIILSPGPRSDASSDWSYLTNLTGSASR